VFLSHKASLTRRYISTFSPSLRLPFPLLKSWKIDEKESMTQKTRKAQTLKMCRTPALLHSRDKSEFYKLIGRKQQF
jgi:hypothetical protein